MAITRDCFLLKKNAGNAISLKTSPVCREFGDDVWSINSNPLLPTCHGIFLKNVESWKKNRWLSLMSKFFLVIKCQLWNACHVSLGNVTRERWLRASARPPPALCCCAWCSVHQGHWALAQAPASPPRHALFSFSLFSTRRFILRGSLPLPLSSWSVGMHS